MPDAAISVPRVQGDLRLMENVRLPGIEGTHSCYTFGADCIFSGHPQRVATDVRTEARVDPRPQRGVLTLKCPCSQILSRYRNCLPRPCTEKA